ncbi:hypothetical protein ABZ370_07725 [Streptomyces sp. NPDC005962]|uniref:hypothetical protein n=1 Tax=Streptomyces sp. NPDC005962 TaxID=3154466 RepID=UPI0033F8ADE1
MEELPFFAEVRVVASPGRPDLRGYIGAIVGISEPPDPGTEPHYGVMLDGLDVVYVFTGEQITPTGRERRESDYYGS